MNAIGIDLGTTSLSAIVMEEGTGEVVETINSPATRRSSRRVHNKTIARLSF